VVYRSSQCEFCCCREIVVQVVVFSLSFAVCPMRFFVTLFLGGRGLLPRMSFTARASGVCPRAY
jgi:hypothetical protein